MKIIDLTLPIYNGMPTVSWDPDPLPTENVLSSLRVSFNTIYRTNIHGFNSTLITMSTHQSTHIDSPKHVSDFGQGVEEIPLERLIGKALLIDLSSKKKGSKITREDIETSLEDIREVDMLVLYTGWSKWFRTQWYFKDYPTLTLDAANLLSELDICLVGIDTPSIVINDKGSLDPNASPHVKLLSKGILIVEGLTNLDKITKKKFMLIVLPLKLEKMDASPVRVIAIEDLSL